ncbi:MAG: hypothetical protein EAZ99_19835 [Alphaproteobacteria bacterium]|nr:MAG: hypothetical protein EAZ99_19835 [Alphaproteobacteria bacterium]
MIAAALTAARALGWRAAAVIAAVIAALARVRAAGRAADRADTVQRIADVQLAMARAAARRPADRAAVVERLRNFIF